MKRAVYTVLLFVLLAGSVQPARADWGDFFDEDGNLKPGVVDLGVQKVPADWMPDVPGWVPDWIYDGAATYHMYALPSGESVLLPSATTLFFMAMNPRESGLVDSQGYIAKALGFAAANQFSDSQSLLAHIFDIFKLPNSKELADAAIRGENVWSFLSADDHLSQRRETEWTVIQP